MVSFELFFFFFQAEDGIRDDLVTGVQTCALPIYTFNIGEKCWGEEANKNFKTLDELVKEVSENKNNHLILTNNVNENATNIQQPKTDLEDNISVTKKALQDQIDILINQIINLQYQVSNLSSVDEAQHAVLAGTATLAVTAATARKVEHSLTIGDIVFNGQEDKSIAIDGEPTENSLNLINSEAVYKALELKQDKATTLSGYNITDAYTKSEVDTNLDGKSNTDHTHDDKYYTKSEVDVNLDGKSDTDHNHDDKYYTKSEVDTNLDGKSNTDHTHSDYLTGITKAMVTDALGYTPSTQDTDTTYSAGSNLSLSDTTFNVLDNPSFTSIVINGFTITID